MSRAWGGFEPCVKVLIAAGAASLLILAWLGGRLWTPRLFLPPSTMGKLFWLATAGYGAVMLAAMIWRVALWWRYRPLDGLMDEALPTVSVLIPAFNEGALVRQAILSAAASRYPADKLEIIAIDDGSTDDTWLHILAATREAKRRVRVTPLRHLSNKGKRRALHLGFAEARGDVFVTLDSDSVLERNALRNVVTPLVREPAVGCVAGCVEVLNPQQSLMTRFLKCYFSMSFKFVRAYQNEFRGVFCTPGALSAYRAEVVRRIADEWLAQRFLGQACTTGEDRAMTNLFLREGWLTAYQGNAVVRSNMPHTFAGLTRMFLRWARSNIRETIVLFRFLFSRFRAKHLHAFRANMLLVVPSLVLPPLLVADNAALVAMNEGYLLHRAGVILIFAAVSAAIYYRNERDSDWVWLLVYKFFWVACLSWILPYAAMTLRNTCWLTRGSNAHRPVPAKEDPWPGMYLPVPQA
ncbi:MAG TPA: glycosyltransferase [Phycisphaerae bacterium]|nr:glycosyltransferase [Phycisphaerae bacterium]